MEVAFVYIFLPLLILGFIFCYELARYSGWALPVDSSILMSLNSHSELGFLFDLFCLSILVD